MMIRACLSLKINVAVVANVIQDLVYDINIQYESAAMQLNKAMNVALNSATKRQIIF